MSWDKYNEAKKAALAAEKAAKSVQNNIKLTETKTKASKKKTSSTPKQKTEIKKKAEDVKVVAKSVYNNKIGLIIFAIIAILALVSLCFSSQINGFLNQQVANNSILTTASNLISNSKATINYLDVGQGDCIAVNLPGNKNMLIDAGNTSKDTKSKDKILNYIENELLDKNEIIDYFIITHPDQDHIEFVDDILNKFPVGTIYRSNTYYKAKSDSADQIALEAREKEYAESVGAVMTSANSKSTDVMYEYVSAMYSALNISMTAGKGFSDKMKLFSNAQPIKEKDFTITFYGQKDRTKTYSDWNNYSCITVLECGGSKFAFTGDTEAQLEKDLLQLYDLPDVDAMDAGHHGSGTSSSEALLNKLKPEYVFISCGLNNKYNHPNKEALDRYRQIGVTDDKIFITANNGDISFGMGYVDQDNAHSYAVALTNGGITPTVHWWYIVVGIIVFSAIIIFVVVPPIFKSKKKIISKQSK